jgi:diguanylate cyclase (GGDEF)-like protein
VLPALTSKGLWRGELVIDRRQGVPVPVSLVVVAHTRSDGQLERMSFVARDITEQRALHDQLSRDAHSDPLTGLANRRVFYAELARTLEAARGSGAPVVALYIDLDGFKLVNDRFGHEAGDQVLVIVAQRLQQHLRNRDVLARMGGDEFALICPELSSERAALDVAERLTTAVSEPLWLQGVSEPVRIGMSTGIAFAPHAELDAETIVRRADRAMYDAKHNHNGGFQLVTLGIPGPRSESSSAVL